MARKNKSGWTTLQCQICGDWVYRFRDKYKEIDDPIVIGKKAIAHQRCFTLNKYRLIALKQDQRDCKSERALRFKTLNSYRKVTELKQSHEAHRKAELAENRRIKVVKKTAQQHTI